MSRNFLARSISSDNMALGMIVASGLTLVEGDQVRIAGLSLTVKAGEIVALVGKPGSGKSKCLALIAGVIEPTFGVLRLSEAPFSVIQPNAATDRNVPTNGSTSADSSREPGARSMFGLVLALASDSSLILIDEPMKGLTAEQAKRAWKILRNMSDAGKAVLVSVDHSDLDSVDCDRFYLMENGTVTSRGTLRDVPVRERHSRPSSRQSALPASAS